MKVKCIWANDKEFTNDKQELVRGFSLLFFNEQSGETFKFFVNNEDLKGFDPKQIAKVNGKTLEISSMVKTFQGKSRTVLDNIIEIA